ncbi:hypothetical protein [Acinetobacter indicus]|uniref:hypothetical protein n=1 Tax=Acinetobacter indicus TaxID=756892 RepID=UPI00209B3E29|nr:hypothetical protein [Acinetobacter indicus]MCO8100881.1 hypothetical protein [Acinetobacter indicus]MCO8106470.1 hypothetical protein [Acinetobacter indicus]MCO8112144.1 hypothetical protein [Acinetobacter indicus]
MKANEFVKKFGWGEATAFLSMDSDVEIVYTASFFDDLKRLVESYELVESYGGLSKARNHVERTVFKLSCQIIALKKAIADVESCQ